MLYFLVVLLSEALVFLHDLVESSLDTLLAVCERVAVAVQQAIHVGTLNHLHQDRGQLALQSQQPLKTHTPYVVDVTYTGREKHISMYRQVPLQKQQRSSVLGPRLKHRFWGHGGRCCVNAVGHSQGSQHSLLQEDIVLDFSKRTNTTEYHSPAICHVLF